MNDRPRPWVPGLRTALERADDSRVDDNLDAVRRHLDREVAQALEPTTTIGWEAGEALRRLVYGRSPS